jgi:hypothetical protein
MAAMTRQIARLDTRYQVLKARSLRLANIRLAAAALGVIATGAAAFLISLAAGTAVLAVSAAIFIGLVIVHRRVDRAMNEIGEWRDIKRENLARMRLDWENIPASHVIAPHGHPFAADLDVPLLHRLISTATTRQGADRLYGWLLTTEPHLPGIAARQALVHELVPMGIFRTRLVLYGRLNAESIGRLTDGDRLIEWLRQRQTPVRFGLFTMMALIAALVNLVLIGILINLATFLTVFAGVISPDTLKVSLIVYAGLFLYQRQRAGDVFREATDLHNMIETLGSVMFFVSTWQYQEGSRLQTLTQAVVKSQPGKHLRRVSWLASGASLGGNPFLWLISNLFVPIDLLVAWGLYREKAALLKEVPGWLDLWYTLDGLASLATFAALNPDYTFPLLKDGEPMVSAQGLCHPLIRAEDKAPNDITIERPGEIWLITGSNMSGKSTFLRSVGANVVLAQAGGVIDAPHFEVHLFRLFSSMRISDSIPEGLSYFYAEVKRLKALLDAVNADDPLPVLFLIDEIFRGTNNRERLIGSTAYVRALVGKNAVGMIATHDLELAHLAEGQPLLHNYHFEERVEDGRLIFDYKIKQGPSTSTNALFIMQREGLPVEADSG